MAVGEEVLQHQPLCHGGVLVLVDEHHGEPFTQVAPDLFHLGDGHSQAHEVGEAHHSVASPIGPDLLDHLRDEKSLSRRGERVARRGAGLVDQRLEKTLIVRAQRLRCDEVFGQLVVKARNPIADRADHGGS